MKFSWKELLGLLLLISFTLPPLAANDYTDGLNRQLKYVIDLTNSAKKGLSLNLMSFPDMDSYAVSVRQTRNTFNDTRNYIRKELKDSYYQALGFLILAAAVAPYNPELPRAYQRNAQGKFDLWFPYKDVMRDLEDALLSSAWLTKSSYPNRYGLIADIAFFVHLEYDRLRESVEVIAAEDGEGPSLVEKPSRVVYTRAEQAIAKAIENEKLSLASTAREKKGITRLSEKAYLFAAVRSRFVRNGVDSSELSLLLVPAYRQDSLPSLARAAYQQSQVKFTETKAFQFFDFVADLVIPNYGTAKRALELISDGIK
jgi:hypothetical protein